MGFGQINRSKKISIIFMGLLIFIILSPFQNCSRSFNISNSEDPEDPQIQKIPYKVKKMSKSFNVDPSGAQLDILVVIDDSRSMKFEQKSMSERMGSFIDQLGEKQDYQIGIITTSIFGGKNKRDGQFLPFHDLNDEYILKSKVHTKEQILSAFKSTIQTGADGNSLEQGMFATWRAISRSIDPLQNEEDQPNRDFFRKNSSLDVILISDADESPNPNQKDKITSADDLVKRVDSAFPGKPFRFHSIIVKPEDQACRQSNEDFGSLYAATSLLTQGVIGSVCATDYGIQLSEIGKRVINSTRQFTLDCKAVPSSEEKTEVDGVISGPAEFNPSSATFNGLFVSSTEDLPPGEYTIEYFCRDDG